jgi:hypothetical protein
VVPFGICASCRREPQMSNDLLVIGLDLTTGREVHVDDQTVDHWRGKGVTGNKTLVCLFCRQGMDQPEPRLVPLVVKGRVNGRRRPHFAHPANAAPAGGHGPETQWHAAAKRLIADWAKTRSNVTDVDLERWIGGRLRRSDVRIKLQCGTTIAIEVQQQHLTDQAWIARHRDYAAAAVVDVWLWHPATGVPHVMFAERQPGWTLDLNAEAFGALIGTPNGPGSDHWPPLPGDRTTVVHVPLHTTELSATGLELPDHLKPWAQAPAKDAPHSLERPGHPPRLPAQPVVASPARRPTVPQAHVVPRSRLMLFPRGIRPQRSTIHLVSASGHSHQISRVDALPPFANPPDWERYVCRTCGDVISSLDDHR